MKSPGVRLEFNNLETLFSEMRNYANIMCSSNRDQKFSMQVTYATKTYPTHDMNCLMLYEHNIRDVMDGNIKLIDEFPGYNAFGFAKYDDDRHLVNITTISIDMLRGMFRNQKMIEYSILMGTYVEGQDPYWLSFRLKRKKRRTQ